MQLLKQQLWRIIVWLHNQLDFFISIRLAQQFYRDISYVSQCASPELLDQARPYDPAKDSNWATSGATSTEEYQFWVKHVCGMTCLSMALQNEGQTIPPITLALQCQQHGGYATDPTILNQQGLVYQPFCRFLDQEFDWESQVKAPMSVGDIEVALQSGRYVIASVHHQIAQPPPYPKIQGGHLILMLGFDRKAQTLTYHDPWGSALRRRRVAISVKDFRSIYAWRGIIFGPK